MSRLSGGRNAALPKHLQIVQLKKRFNRLNPGVGTDVIDWESAVGRRESYQENIEDLKAEYPEYRFDRKNDPVKQAAKYDRMNDYEARRALQKSGFAVVKKRDYKVLLENYRARQQQIANADARRHVPPGARRGGGLVKVRTHYRRPPRN